MRTQDEIAERMAASSSLFGFDKDVYVSYLDFEHAKPYLKPEIKWEEWTFRPLEREAVLHDMREYMAFAWSKVQDHRGLSANRSIEKMRAWIWVLGDEDFTAGIEYAQYGAPILRAICVRYGFPVPQDEGSQNMMHGASCRPSCEDGCG